MPASQITELLQAWGTGDKEALGRLTPLLYARLHKLAHRYMRQERSGHTLQTTALINEAYIRLVGWDNVNIQNRSQFLAVSAQLMRRILVDYARSKNYEKRGGGVQPVPLDDASLGKSAAARDIVALDEALTALNEFDPRKCQIVELRFFGGLTVEETAKVLDVSSRTILREWDLAKAWLGRELSKHQSKVLAPSPDGPI